MDDFIYIDVAVQKTAEEAGGFDVEDMRRRKLAVAVTWREQHDGFRSYYEQDCQRLIDDLNAAECVVGFNCIGFDYEVIRGHLPFDTPNTLDIFRLVSERTGFRVPLASLAVGTLGDGNYPSGLDTTKQWRKGRREYVIESCKKGVELIRRIHLHIQQHGWVKTAKGKHILIG